MSEGMLLLFAMLALMSTAAAKVTVTICNIYSVFSVLFDNAITIIFLVCTFKVFEL